MVKFFEWLLSIFKKSESQIEPTPWMDWMKAKLGGSEFDPAFVKVMEQGWKFTNVPGYKGLAGSARAWCAMTVNFALESCGYQGNKRADAKSFRTYGTPCEFKYGAIISMRHKDGSNHVTFFSHWVDEKNRIAACLGGNQDNKLRVSNYNLSGNSKGHDECIGGPRWPVKKKA